MAVYNWTFILEWISKSFSRNNEFNCWSCYRLITRQVKFAIAMQKFFVISSSCFFKMLSSIFLILIKSDCLADWRRGQWSRKWVVVFMSRPQTHIGSWKLCPKLWQRKWLKCKRSLVSNFKSYWLFISKTL